MSANPPAPDVVAELDFAPRCEQDGAPASLSMVLSCPGHEDDSVRRAMLLCVRCAVNYLLQIGDDRQIHIDDRIVISADPEQYVRDLQPLGE